MVQLKTLFVSALTLAVATCNPVGKRDAALVLTDLTAVNSQLDILTASVTSFTGGILPALTIATNGNNLDLAINKATLDTNATIGAFSAADSTAVVAKIAILTPKIQATVAALIPKKSLFAALSLVPVVLNQIQTLAADSAALGVALRAKAQAADLPALLDYQATIDGNLQLAAAYYST